MSEHLDRNPLYERLRTLKVDATETTIAMLDRAARVDGGLPNPSIWVDGDHVEMEWNPGGGWSVTLEFQADEIIGDATNTKTGDTDDFALPLSIPHDNLIADIHRLLTRAGWPGDGWPRTMTKTGMQEDLVGNFSATLSGCHGDFYNIGPTLAALALYEAISDVSEATYCASWLSDGEVGWWRWLQGTEPVAEWSSADDLTEERERIRALANIAGVWWADYRYAVPLSDWIARHGTAPGLEGWTPKDVAP